MITRRPSVAAVIVFAAITTSVVVADQVSKFQAIAHLTDALGPAQETLDFSEAAERFLWTKHPGRRPQVTVVDNFWNYRYIENPGAAWGFLSGSASQLRTPFFLCVSLVAMGFILTYFARSADHERSLRTALALVLGGAVGNFLDRIRLGYVIDFIDWHIYDRFTWPTFNVADAAITVGVVILLVDMMTQKKTRLDIPR